MHGFDLAKDVAAGGSARFDFRADLRGVLRGRARGRPFRSPSSGSSREPTQKVRRSLSGGNRRRSCAARPGRRARPHRSRRPADPGMALRLGGRRRLDRVVRRPRGALAKSAAGEGQLLSPAPEELSRAILNRGTETLAAVIGVGLLVVTVWSGLAGVQSPQENFAPTFVYVVFWVGLVVASIAFGDVFRAFNPWRAIGRATGFVFHRFGFHMQSPFAYPRWLGRWPAAAGLLGFAWLELVYPGGDDPSVLALAVLVYTTVTFAAMACFGTRRGSRAARRSPPISTFFAHIVRHRQRWSARAAATTFGNDDPRAAARNGRASRRDDRERHVRRRERRQPVDRRRAGHSGVLR